MPGKAAPVGKAAKKTAKKNLLPAFDRVARDADSHAAKVARPACMGDDVAMARASHAVHDA